MVYEIMHRENCVAQISTAGECKIYLEDFMPYGLILEESNDFDRNGTYGRTPVLPKWCAARQAAPAGCREGLDRIPHMIPFEAEKGDSFPEPRKPILTHLRCFAK